MSCSRNDKTPVIPSAVDFGVEVVVLEGIDCEMVDGVVFFDDVTKFDGKPRFAVDETGGDCFVDDIEDKGRGEERIGFGPTAESRRNVKTLMHKSSLRKSKFYI